MANHDTGPSAGAWMGLEDGEALERMVDVSGEGGGAFAGGLATSIEI